MSTLAPRICWDRREPPPPEIKKLFLLNNSISTGYPNFPPADDQIFVATHNPHSNRDFKGIPTTETGIQPTNIRNRNPDYVTQEPTRNVLAPWAIDVDVLIVQDTACIKTTQIFWNNSTSPISQGSYMFPLPTGCTVTEFSCRIGSKKTLNGVVKPKQEARQEFRAHVSANRVAGLLEQDTPEVFSSSLGNIPQDTRVKIQISYTTLLKYHFIEDKEKITLTIPSYIARRYGDPPRPMNTATSDIEQGLRLNIKILQLHNIPLIHCLSHKIRVEARAKEAVASSWADIAGQETRPEMERMSLVRLDEGSMFLNKDFVLEIQNEAVEGQNVPQTWIENNPTEAHQKALMVTLPTGFLNEMAKGPPRQKEVLFLVDQSGSMDDKLDSLRSAMLFFLKGIPVGDKFNIGRFGSDFTSWCPQSVQYSQDSLDSALSYLSTSINADMGGTEILNAISSTIRARDPHMWTDIVILTDGEVWRLEDTLAAIRDARKVSKNQIRFFCLGIGNGVSHALVEGIAKLGGGYAEVVPADAKDGWEDRLVSMQAAAQSSSPVSEIKIRLETKEGELDPSKYRQSPAKLEKINPFVRSRIYMLLESEHVDIITNITLEVILPDGTKVKRCLPMSVIEGNDTVIHKLAARSILEDIENDASDFHNRSTGVDLQVWGSEAEQMACKWGVLSKWTSFVLAENSGDGEGTIRSLVTISDGRQRGNLLRKFNCLDHGAVLVGDDDDDLFLQNSSARGSSGPRRPRRQRGDPLSDTYTYYNRRQAKTRGSASLKKDSSNEVSIYDQRSPPTPIRDSPKRCLPGGKFPLVMTAGDPSTSGPPPKIDLGQNEKKFIMSVLKFQSFDGSVSFATNFEAIEILGEGVLGVIQQFADQSLPKTLLYTMAVLIILEQQCCLQKKLWQTMHSKASRYIRAAGVHVTDASMTVLRKELEGVKVPRDDTSEESEAAQDILVDSSYRKRFHRSTAGDSEHQQRKCRAVVQSAPSDYVAQDSSAP